MNYNNLDVIIPTYNRAKFLDIALDAVCSSTAGFRKIIVLNNHSTDNTIQVVKNAQQKFQDRCIEVITNEKNIGNYNNFKKTQEISDNEYVAVFHDDDAIHPEYIERAMSILTKDNTLVCCSGGGGMYNVTNTNWLPMQASYFYYPKSKSTFLQLIVARFNFFSMIYKNSVYKKVKYHPEKYGKLHDLPFLCDITSLGNSIYLNTNCARWRLSRFQDSNTLSTGPFPEEILNILSSFKKRLHTELTEDSDLKGYKLVAKTLLYNFSYFLYNWADIKIRNISWKEFENEMIKYRIFKEKDFIFFEKFIDVIANPLVRKAAEKFRSSCMKTNSFRLGE